MPESAATRPESSQWAWTSSQSARRRASTERARKSGASQGRRRSFATTPPVAGQRRVDDLDGHALRPEALDRVGHEATRGVVVAGGEGGREDGDAERLRPVGPGASRPPALVEGRGENTHGRGIGGRL